MRYIHLIGIGGIGVSALAQYFLAHGNNVSGSDIKKSAMTDFLKRKKIKIYIGHKASSLNSKTSLVVYSAAVDLDKNPEVIEAKKRGIKILSYAETLGQLTKKFFTIAVAGSHGKSTTSSMLSLVLINAGFDPTIIVGTKLKELGNGNFRLGKSKYLVIEADEYNKSFLNYEPDILIITNIDKEHLDTYKNLEEIIKTFGKYFNNIKLKGSLIINKKDKNSIKALGGFNKKDVKIVYYNQKLPRLNLKVLGVFNKVNADAVLAASKILKIKELIAKKSLENYRGVWRRMEVLKEAKNMIFLSDYAHHPTEIQATIKALKEFYKNRKIIVVFQAHQLQRLNLLFDDFAKSFDLSDVLILLPAFKVAGRESGKFKKGIDDLIGVIGRRPAFKKKKICRAKNIKDVFSALSDYKKQPLLAVFMGAGDIDENTRRYFKV